MSAARKRHRHEKRWTMGEHPIVARCTGCEKVLVNEGEGSRWVKPEQVRRAGWTAAL